MGAIHYTHLSFIQIAATSGTGVSSVYIGKFDEKTTSAKNLLRLITIAQSAHQMVNKHRIISCTDICHLVENSFKSAVKAPCKTSFK